MEDSKLWVVEENCESTCRPMLSPGELGLGSAEQRRACLHDLPARHYPGVLAIRREMLRQPLRYLSGCANSLHIWCPDPCIRRAALDLCQQTLAAHISEPRHPSPRHEQLAELLIFAHLFRPAEQLHKFANVVTALASRRSRPEGIGSSLLISNPNIHHLR